jgi:anti-sigma factor RsiW
MANVVDLVTRLDLDALADNQLSGRRFDAVQSYLEQDGGALAELARMDLLNEVLKLSRPAIYRDRELRDEVKRRLRRRAA